MIVSNTEVSMFNTCERSHYYRFILGVEPRRANLSVALTRGIIGHDAFEVYYNVLKNGGSVPDALEAAKEVIREALTTAVSEQGLEVDTAIFSGLIKLFDEYAKYYAVEPFKVIAVESVLTAPINKSLDYGLKLDLLVEMTSGPLRGNLVLIDHKFVYNFKTDAEIAMDTQLSKYARVLRLNGYKVYHRWFNQIRHRSLKEPQHSDILRRIPVTTTDKEVDRIWLEQERIASEIVLRKDMPREAASDIATRNLTPFICRGCMFQKLCKLDLQGKPLKNELVMNYQKNTYGYTDLSEDL